MNWLQLFRYKGPSRGPPKLSPNRRPQTVAYKAVYRCINFVVYGWKPNAHKILHFSLKKKQFDFESSFWNSDQIIHTCAIQYTRANFSYQLLTMEGS